MDGKDLIDLMAQLDGTYTPFPQLSAWSTAGVKTSHWTLRADALTKLKTETRDDIWERGIDIALRVAAVDTGALENLYKTDHGFTFSIATQSMALNSQEKQRYEEIKGYFEAQLLGFKLTLDAITSKTEITEAWIRALHEVLTAAQETYKVFTPYGEEERKLEKGVYKKEPNHVLDRDGKPFAYAPVLQVQPEMERLIKSIQSDEFANLHPAIQASYAHYAFVRIHPFADGNGRVARAFASYFLMKSNSIPLLILLEQRDEYLNALQAADKGNYKPLNEFVFIRGIEAMQIVEDFAKAAAQPELTSTLDRIANLYYARDGVQHSELDDLGEKFFRAAQEALSKAVSDMNLPGRHEVSTSQAKYKGAPQGYRTLVKSQGPTLSITLSTRAPAEATVTLTFVLYVTKGDVQPDGDLIIQTGKGTYRIGASTDDVRRSSRAGISATLKLRLDAWAMGTINGAAAELEKLAEASFKASGYGQP
jgi:Fic family protein